MQTIRLSLAALQLISFTALDAADSFLVEDGPAWVVGVKFE